MIEMPWKIIALQTIRGTTAKPGELAVAELVKIAPGFFAHDAAPRVYWITNTGTGWSLRGGHVHPDGGKREIIVALAGAIEFDLHAAMSCGKIVLDDPGHGLLIPNGVWHGVRISPGGILLSIASTLYASDESVTAKPCRCP
ncbi:MAG: FdtA/QdtA family cupin domain-containing protein [Patescibacteria group bacterium]|nr:MAG: FdtA/QdtA family cupin domain-containing protein [Patescibacteria group bacterium]